MKLKRKPKSNQYKASQSKIKTWRRCRREYHYKFVMNIEPRRKPKALMWGSIFHDMIEAHTDGKDPWKVLSGYEKKYNSLFLEEREMYGDIIGDTRRIMTGYFKWWQNDPIEYLSPKGSKKKCEHYFEVELENGVLLTGKLDAFGRTRDRRHWLVETKSCSRMPEDQFRYSDIQSMIYVKLAPKYLGFPQPDGVAWNYILKRPPGVPELLKSGELSKRKIMTTPEIYMAEIKRHKLDPKDYADILKQLEENEDKFFHRAYLPVNQKIMDTIYNETLAVTSEMAELHHRPETHTRNITFDCQRCSYYKLCQAELRGLDVDYMIKKDFKPREDHYAEEIEEAAE